MTAGKPKTRIDQELVRRGLANSRTRAQEWIREGRVRISGRVIEKPSEEVSIGDPIEVVSVGHEYVSRGAHKLIAALDRFQVMVTGKTAIDIGASTGGFTEVLLERGAKEVTAVDVGSGQLAEKIRTDPRVRVKEKYHARHFRPEDFASRFDLLVMDVSFISIRLLLGSVLTGLEPGADLIVLFKPQFEVGREGVGEGGIVLDQELARRTLRETLEWAETIGLESRGWMVSPLAGGDGNIEYLIHWTAFPKPRYDGAS